MKDLVIGYGNVGKLVAEELKSTGDEVTIGSHDSSRKIPGYDSVSINMLENESVVQAVQGQEVVFVTTGLPYKLSVWRGQWPVIIDNVIAACKAAGAKLVFIDNIYLYGPSPLQSPMAEEHPRYPESEKGKVRLELVVKLESAMKDGLDVLIVRCADFYGPGVTTSGLNMALVAANKGKKAYFMGDKDTKHAYSYVPDIAKASVLLVRDPRAYNQTWHVPTASPITGVALMELVEKSLDKKVKWSSMRPTNMRLLSLFVPILRELREMMYQFENDYAFDSTKFQKRYPKFKVTQYDEGIAATIEAMK